MLQHIWLQSSGIVFQCDLKNQLALHGQSPIHTGRDAKQIGCTNPVVATGLYTLHAKQHMTCTIGIWFHFVALRVVSRLLLPVWMGPKPLWEKCLAGQNALRVSWRNWTGTQNSACCVLSRTPKRQVTNTLCPPSPLFPPLEEVQFC